MFVLIINVLALLSRIVVKGHSNTLVNVRFKKNDNFHKSEAQENI